jgi:hypothetical protein
MPRKESKLGSPRAGRFLRVGQDLITIALDDRLWWRLLVPIADNDGLVFTARHHEKFDGRVYKISGGSTENPWSNGKWRERGRLYKERMIPLEFLATTEQADAIAAFALVHYDQLEILCVPISDRVRRYRRADQAKPSKLLARVGKAIRRGIRRIGREFFAVLQGSQKNGRRPGEGSRHQEVGSGLVDAATAQAESACRQTEGRDHEARRRRGLSVAGNRHRTSTKAAKRRRPR